MRITFPVFSPEPEPLNQKWGGGVVGPALGVCEPVTCEHHPAREVEAKSCADQIEGDAVTIEDTAQVLIEILQGPILVPPHPPSSLHVSYRLSERLEFLLEGILS